MIFWMWSSKGHRHLQGNDWWRLALKIQSSLAGHRMRRTFPGGFPLSAAILSTHAWSGFPLIAGQIRRSSSAVGQCPPSAAMSSSTVFGLSAGGASRPRVLSDPPRLSTIHSHLPRLRFGFFAWRGRAVKGMMRKWKKKAFVFSLIRSLSDRFGSERSDFVHLNAEFWFNTRKMKQT